MIKYITVDLIINSLCNMDCLYCNAHTLDKDDILDFDKIKLTVTKIHQKYPNNKINFILLGGELTVLPSGYLYKIVKWLKSQEFTSRIHLFTNAKIYSEELNRCLHEFDNTYLRVSLDTINPIVNMRPIEPKHIIEVINKYDVKDYTIVDSTLNGLTLEFYRDLQDFFVENGINMFKFKFERSDAFIIENWTHNKNKFVDKFLSVIRRDVKYIDNFNLNTVVITSIFRNIDMSIHLDERNDRSNRNVLGKIDIPEELLWNVYE